MAEYESVLCVKQEVFVYKIPARTSNRGFRAAEWKLDEPDWTGRLKVVAKQRDLFVKLEDKTSGELFAQCPVESYPSSAIEQVLDSSRYFVIRIQDGSARHAFIGLGFADRGDSFDLLVAIQDHFKHVKREETEDTDASSLGGEEALNPGPKLDLSLKEGQTIKLNFVTKKSGESSSSKPRPKGQAGASAILLPPPPGGVKIAGPPRQAPVGQQQPIVSSMQPGPPPTFSMQPKAPSNPVAPQSNMDLLLDLGINSSVTRPSAPQGGSEAWDDFAGAGSKPPTQKAAEPKTFMWENFE